MGGPRIGLGWLWVSQYLIWAKTIRFRLGQAKTGWFRLSQQISACFAMFYSELVKNKMSPSHGPFDTHTHIVKSEQHGR